MKVAITGASGQIGRRLMPLLVARGHHVLALSRDPSGYDWPEGVETRAWDAASAPALDDVDAVVNLAGANLVGKRWSARYKSELRRSRIQLTKHLVSGMRKEMTLLSTSAVGYYGIDPRRSCSEDAPAGSDFLAELCHDWEKEAKTHKGRTIIFRHGVVLDPEGHVLQRLKPLYRFRAGGRIAGGNQPFPWIHHEDLAQAQVWALEGDAKGPYNLTGPQQVPQKTFNAAMARSMKVCALAPVPGLAMRIVMGESSTVLTKGQEAPPVRLQEAGFNFRFQDIQDAMNDMVGA